MTYRPGFTIVLAIAVAVLLVEQTQGIQRDPYQVLCVRRSATQQEITKAFRRLSLQYHPDKNPAKDATAKFQEISAAYDYLTDPARQSKPWEWGFGGAPAGSQSKRTRHGGFGPDAAHDAFREFYQFEPRWDWMRSCATWAYAWLSHAAPSIVTGLLSAMALKWFGPPLAATAVLLSVLVLSVLVLAHYNHVDVDWSIVTTAFLWALDADADRRVNLTDFKIWCSRFYNFVIGFDLSSLVGYLLGFWMGLQLKLL